jgi:UDP-2,3-diacylglucosamine pyrophosphatase LpxH
MSVSKRLDEVFENCKEFLIDEKSKIIFFSDCHRGNNSWADNFARNQNVYFAAMQYYLTEGFTYIEIGDGDELWENRKFSVIREAHSHAFWLLSKFHQRNRLIMIYGNHDMNKKSKRYLKRWLYFYTDKRTGETVPLFENIETYEGIVLKIRGTDYRFYVTHGHQGQLFNDKYWKVNRFLVRYFWKPLENLGFMDPTGPGKSYEGREKNDQNIIRWIEKKDGSAIIAGHSHRPSFPKKGKPLYFNDGSCVHPRAITGIEICDGKISLVKWSIKTKDDYTLYIGKDILEGPENIIQLFKRSEEAGSK